MWDPVGCPVSTVCLTNGGKSIKTVFRLAGHLGVKPPEITRCVETKVSGTGYTVLFQPTSPFIVRPSPFRLVAGRSGR